MDYIGEPKYVEMMTEPLRFVKRVTFLCDSSDPESQATTAPTWPMLGGTSTNAIWLASSRFITGSIGDIMSNPGPAIFRNSASNWELPELKLKRLYEVITNNTLIAF